MPLIRDVIDSKRLLMFYHVAKSGSLSRAEALLFMAQPAISRHISRLEEEMGVQLLDRHGRGVTLTSYGEILFRQAEVILQEMQSTIDQIDQAKRNPLGRVSVSGSAIVMSVFMPEIVGRLIDKYPDVEIVAVQAPSGEVFNSLVSGKVDVAIVMQVPNRHKFSLHKLTEEPMVLIASKKNPIAKEKVIKRDMLADLPIILPAAPNGMRAIIEEYAAAGDVEIKSHLQVDSVPLIRETIRRGHYCAIMPQLSFEEEFGNRTFVGIPLKPSMTRTLYAATRKGEDSSPYIKALLEITAQVFKEKAPSSQEKDAKAGD